MNPAKNLNLRAGLLSVLIFLTLLGIWYVATSSSGAGGGTAGAAGGAGSSPSDAADAEGDAQARITLQAAGQPVFVRRFEDRPAMAAG